MNLKPKHLKSFLDAGIGAENSTNYWSLRLQLQALITLGEISATDTITVKDLIIALDKANARWDKAIDKYIYGGRE